MDIQAFVIEHTLGLGQEAVEAVVCAIVWAAGVLVVCWVVVGDECSFASGPLTASDIGKVILAYLVSIAVSWVSKILFHPQKTLLILLGMSKTVY